MNFQQFFIIILHLEFNYSSFPETINRFSRRDQSSNIEPYRNCKREITSSKGFNKEDEIKSCFEEPKLWCSDDTKYRSLDGSCNNLHTRTWGMRNTAMYRLLAPKYDDDICVIRTSLNGRLLPSSITLAQIIVSKTKEAHKLRQITTFFATFGEIVADDVASSDLKFTNDSICCTATTNGTLGELPCDCMPTEMPHGDKCYFAARSKTNLDLQCPIFPVYQLGSVSSFLDASFLYNAEVLRANQDGKLQFMTDKKGRQFPTLLKDRKNAAHYEKSKDKLPKFTINRSNAYSHSGTLTMLTIFLRLHNFLCDILFWLNTDWQDERIFQEARRLLIAMYQHIVYHEFLPIIIGYEYSVKYDLSPMKSKLFEVYDSNINPTTINSFATAAFRNFHAFLPTHLSLVDRHYNIVRNVSFAEIENNIDIMAGNVYDSVIRGAITQSLQGNQVESVETHRTQKTVLNAMDIERGRDHGLPTYNDFRDLCDRPRILNFKHLKSVINAEDAFELADLYEDVDNIDLYVGGILENTVKDEIVGPTFQCLIAEAFYRYKYGDRFFYEHKRVPGQFTKEQLTEIKKVTASLLICITSDSISKVQTNIFYLPSKQNPNVPCELILRPDYSWWQEKRDEPKRLTKMLQ